MVEQESDGEIGQMFMVEEICEPCGFDVETDPLQFLDP